MIVSLLLFELLGGIRFTAEPLDVPTAVNTCVAENHSGIYYLVTKPDSYTVELRKSGLICKSVSVLDGKLLPESARGHGRFLSVNNKWNTPNRGWVTSSTILDSHNWNNVFDSGGGEYRSILPNGVQIHTSDKEFRYFEYNSSKVKLPLGYVPFTEGKFSSLAVSPWGKPFVATLKKESDGSLRPFVWNHLEASPFALQLPKGYENATADAVNSRGNVAGTLQSRDGAVACLWTDGKVRILPKLIVPDSQVWMPIFLTDDGLVLGVAINDYQLPPFGRLWVSNGETTLWLDQTIVGGGFDSANRSNIGSNGTDILVRLRAKQDSKNTSGWYRLRRTQV